MIISDAFLVSTGAVEQLVSGVEAAGLSTVVWTKTVPDPTTASLSLALSALDGHRPDCVVGFGGGSPIDTAKALALLAIHGGEMRRFKAPHVNVGPALPIIAVPTTAGSGSEVTQFTIITDSVANEKMLCTGPAFMPLAAIVDSELTSTMPPRLTADTGIDALTHAIEAYVSKKSNPFSDSLALAAIETIGRTLPGLYVDGGNPSAREKMALAATQAGIAFSNSSVALVHGMSRPIGAHFQVAHGMSNAMLFPEVTRFSAHADPARYADCARALGAARVTDDDAKATTKLIDSISDLCRDLQVPTPHSHGIDWARWDLLIPTMANQALASGSPGNNPRVPTGDQICEIYSRVYR